MLATYGFAKVRDVGKFAVERALVIPAGVEAILGFVGVSGVGKHEVYITVEMVIFVLANDHSLQLAKFARFHVYVLKEAVKVALQVLSRLYFGSAVHVWDQERRRL